ncbi:phosphatidate cytidylyltransferase [Roseibacillus ishigakijimensis]|uniref:Phosphatidate cytidylyltransferase n=1 Tax=Roseibacillus ishigakijimensis TaxID=454146 RepID=A0A934RQ93_9BACT|nr:phosphatidate cytidylyltransferase [Roseibacillus ishigakijimensis]MBK1835499.1 phosphatidate cytidylyltransferase [Roseibacillus ishigakijimensis]
MNALSDPAFRSLLTLLLSVLLLASGTLSLLARRPILQKNPALVKDLRLRTRSWWVMIGLFLLASLLGKGGSLLLFALISFQALRELVTLMATHRHEHRTLAWSFFIILPLHYLFIGLDRYGIWTIFLPVYGFLFLPVRNLLTGSSEDFLLRTARNHWALGICVYALSHAPALLCLGEGATGIKLLFFLVIICQGSDVFQYLWGKSCGKHPVAPAISPKKTREGTLGGLLTAGLLGIALAWATPFLWWQAGLMALVIAVCGFFGDLTLSAIKRDHRAKDFGTLIPGHGGILDRVDSLAFAAPVFFHLSKFFWFS